jgi:Host cell surface-exposed lipoprotein
MTHHPDAPSGQPYSPPPWDQNRLPPPSPWPGPQFSENHPNRAEPGGDGGGGKKHRKWPWIVGGIAVLAVIGGIAGGNSADTPPKVAAPAASQAPYPSLPPEQKAANASASHAPKAPPAPTSTTAKPKPPPPAKPKLTVSQENAVAKAEDYLAYTAFSRSGLIEQLEFDQFSKADATYAVDHITVDWKEQAARKAKDYLDYTSFSRGGLIGQLEFDGFTRAQAVYAVNKAGL